MVVIFVIIGALIGAGFASGQEIYIFFYKYGLNGIWGLVICSILTGWVIYKTFLIIFDRQNNNDKIIIYEDFLNLIFSKKNFNIKKGYKFNIVKITNFVINVSLLITFYVMISGFGAYFEQEFSIDRTIGALILSVICFFVFMTSVKGVTRANTLVVPVLIICIVIIGIINLMQVDYSMIGKNLNNVKNINDNIEYAEESQAENIKISKENYSQMSWVWKSIIYCSYNMILLIPVLVNLKDYIKRKRQIVVISILSGIIVFILAMSIYLLLVNIDVDFGLLEMPAVYVISKYFAGFRTIYGIVILLSIFTTAISVGISFLENMVKNKMYFPQFAGIMCITGVLISNFGFSNLVNITFPVFGYLGLIQITFILFNRKKNWYK